MARKIFKASPLAGLIGKKKKAADPVAPAAVEGQAKVAALTPEEAEKRRLLPKKPPLGIGTSILGNLSGTLGG